MDGKPKSTWAMVAQEAKAGGSLSSRSALVRLGVEKIKEKEKNPKVSI